MGFAMHLQRALLFPCTAVMAASLYATGDPVAARPAHRQAKLTDAQQQSLFQVRRDWELRSYPQRLALLKNERHCLRQARSPEAYRRCKVQNNQARWALYKQGRARLNAERERLGLQPLRPRQQKSRS